MFSIRPSEAKENRTLVIFLSIMGETGNDLPPLDVNLGQSSQESALSGEETLNLVSRLLDSKLDKKFSEFKRGLEQKELATDSQIKKLKTEAKAANSFQFKGNKLQFEFNSILVDSIKSIRFSAGREFNQGKSGVGERQNVAE